MAKILCSKNFHRMELSRNVQSKNPLKMIDIDKCTWIYGVERSGTKEIQVRRGAVRLPSARLPSPIRGMQPAKVLRDWPRIVVLGKRNKIKATLRDNKNACFRILNCLKNFLPFGRRKILCSYECNFITASDLACSLFKLNKNIVGRSNYDFLCQLHSYRFEGGNKNNKSFSSSHG